MNPSDSLPDLRSNLIDSKIIDELDLKFVFAQNCIYRRYHRYIGALVRDRFVSQAFIKKCY